MDKPTIRFYAQINILESYSELVSTILDKHDDHFDVLDSIQLGSRFTFKATAEKNDISILIMRELEATREPQTNWFLRMTDDIINNTNNDILIVVFSDLDVSERKILYEKLIPNSTVHYFNFEDWLDDNIDLSPLRICIDNYLSNKK